MRKIVLTKYGDCVVPQKNTDGTLSFGLKYHDFCCGFVDIKARSKTHNGFTCRNCNFQFAFPKEITTWAELRRFVRIPESPKPPSHSGA